MQLFKVLLVVLIVVNLSAGFFFKKKSVPAHHAAPAPVYDYARPVHYPPAHSYAYPEPPVAASYYYQPAPAVPAYSYPAPAPYAAPIASYAPPVASYAPPAASYAPPVASYVPPVASYAAPVVSYAAPVVGSLPAPPPYTAAQPAPVPVPAIAPRPALSNPAPKAPVNPVACSTHPESGRIMVLKAPTSISQQPTPVAPRPINVKLVAPAAQPASKVKPVSGGVLKAQPVQGLPVFEPVAFQGSQRPAKGQPIGQPGRSPLDVAGSSFEIVPSLGYQSGSSTDFIEIVKSQDRYIALPPETVLIGNEAGDGGSGTIYANDAETELTAPAQDSASLFDAGVDVRAFGTGESEGDYAGYDASFDSNSNTQPEGGALAGFEQTLAQSDYLEESAFTASPVYDDSANDGAYAQANDDALAQANYAPDEQGSALADAGSQPATYDALENAIDISTNLISQDVPDTPSELDASNLDPINFPEVQELLKELVDGKRYDDTRTKKDVASSGDLQVLKSVEIDPQVSYSRVAIQ